MIDRFLFGGAIPVPGGFANDYGLGLKQKADRSFMRSVFCTTNLKLLATPTNLLLE
jgi:hypothetical protein